MNEYQKYESLIKWLAFDPFAQAPNNTDVYIDKYMKQKYAELNTPSGDWGLHRLLDRAFIEGYISYQDREIDNKQIKWYGITSKGKDFAQASIERENLFKNAFKEYEYIDSDIIMDMVLYWFAIEPKDYKGGIIVPRIKVPAETVCKNITDYYFKQLNNIDFIINIDLILDQLSIDGYLHKHIDTGWRPTYSITYNGKKFSKKGGYEGVDRKEKSQKKTQVMKESLLISGTWFAGIAGIFLVVNELLKNFHWAGTITFWMTTFVFGSGVISGIIIYLLIIHLSEKGGND
jgi:hypothetical protein